MKNNPDQTKYIKLNEYSEFIGISRIDHLKDVAWFKNACKYIETDVREQPIYNYRGKGGGTYIHWFLACYILLNNSPNSFYRLLDVEINANSGVDRFKSMLKFHENIERKQYTKNWVYVIKNEIGDFKIGITNDVNKRLKQLQCGNSGKLEIVFKWFTFDAEGIEKNSHARFSKYRLNGEWFDGSKLNPNTIKTYIENGCNLNETIVEMCRYPERRYLENKKEK